MRWLGQLFAGADGKADEMSALCIAGVLSFIALGVYAVVWNHQAFDPMGYGTGLGAAIGAAAAGMGVKAKFGG
jgi:hypothetical protein